MPIDKGCSQFFRRSPAQWGIVEFLNYNENKYEQGRVLDRWRKDLHLIRKSGNQEQQKRASVLLRRCKEKVQPFSLLSCFSATCWSTAGSADLVAPHQDTIASETYDLLGLLMFAFIR